MVVDRKKPIDQDIDTRKQGVNSQKIASQFVQRVLKKYRCHVTAVVSLLESSPNDTFHLQA